jgi:hypothetical protein
MRLHLPLDSTAVSIISGGVDTLPQLARFGCKLHVRSRDEKCLRDGPHVRPGAAAETSPPGFRGHSPSKFCVGDEFPVVLNGFCEAQ